MQIHLLALQRRESYPGEHAPEIVAVCDEVTMDENPTWWAEEVARHQDAVGAEALSWAEVVIELDDAALAARLDPTRVPLPATLLDAPAT